MLSNALFPLSSSGGEGRGEEAPHRPHSHWLPTAQGIRGFYPAPGTAGTTASSPHPSPPEEERANRRASAGFTLAEVLAALVFMAIVIPVALEGLSIASRAGEVAARKGEAALVAERILNENIVTTNWDKTVQNGTVRQGIRDFRWTMRNEPWNRDPYLNYMRLLSVEVTFAAQGQDYSVRLSTLVDSTPPSAQTNMAGVP